MPRVYTRIFYVLVCSNLAHKIRCSKHTQTLGVITHLWCTRLLHTKLWWVMVCYDLVHQIRCAKHTFSGRVISHLWCAACLVCIAHHNTDSVDFISCLCVSVFDRN